MLKIGVISDTHGDLKIIDKIIEYTQDKDINMWVHCGDYVRDAQHLTEKVDIPVVKVRGNCDTSEFSTAEEEIIELDGNYIYIAHGHKLNPDYLEREYEWIREHYDAKLILLGHTHHHIALKLEDTLVVNPGSPSRPRDGSGGTFAIVNYIDDDVEINRYSAEFVYIKDII